VDVHSLRLTDERGTPAGRQDLISAKRLTHTTSEDSQELELAGSEAELLAPQMGPTRLRVQPQPTCFYNAGVWGPARLLPKQAPELCGHKPHRSIAREPGISSQVKAGRPLGWTAANHQQRARSRAPNERCHVYRIRPKYHDGVRYVLAKDSGPEPVPCNPHSGQAKLTPDLQLNVRERRQQDDPLQPFSIWRR